jgi:hypothetical protein
LQKIPPIPPAEAATGTTHRGVGIFAMSLHKIFVPEAISRMNENKSTESHVKENPSE